MSQSRCKICGALLKEKETFYEKMYGTLEEFVYYKCEYCMTYQIQTIPLKLGDYYNSGEGYYSLKENSKSIKHIMRNGILRCIGGAQRLVNRRTAVKLLFAIFKNDVAFQAMSEVGNLTRNSAILDVGCGTGWLIKKLSMIGFTDVLGIDLFISKDSQINKKKVKIVQGNIFDVPDRKFDVIMFHHSLEHVPNPMETMKKACEMLTDDGTIIVRVPVIPNYSFNKYGVNWVNFDAPRHLFNFSLDSFDYMAKLCGMIVSKVIFDSNDFQFWGSELYVKGYQLSEENKQKKELIFGDKAILEWKMKAIRLNKSNEGDTAAIYLMRQ